MNTKTLCQRLRGLLCVWLAALLLLPAAFVQPVAAGTTYSAGNWTALKGYATESTGATGNVYDFGGKTIDLTGEISVPLASDAPITLKNATFTCSSEGVACAFRFSVSSVTATVTLDAITIDGAVESGGHSSPAISCSTSGGTLTVNIANTTLQNWSNGTGNGGGVYAGYGTTLNMTNSTISNCSSYDDGGGVYAAAYSTFDMKDSSITNCSTGTRGKGGGVYVDDDGTFRMTDSEITGCTANSYGGGVYVNDDGTFHMTDSEITGCTANIYGDGGGVYVYASSGGSGNIQLSGATVISGNTTGNDVDNLYLYYYDYQSTHYETFATIDGALTAGARIGVTKGEPTADSPVNVTDPAQNPANSEDYSGYFYADAGATQRIQNSDTTNNIVQLALGATTDSWVDFNMQGHGTDTQVPVTYNEAVNPNSIPAPSASGYTFGGWYTTAACADEWDSTDAVTEPIMVYAKWTASAPSVFVDPYTYYTVTAGAGAGGSISPSGSVSVREGLDRTFTITPQAGYVLSNVLVDGVSVKDKLVGNSYTLGNVQKDHTLQAVFSKVGGSANPFADVQEGDWFYDDVLFAYENGLMNGTSATSFNPQGTTSRGMLVAILYRLAGQPAVTGACPFSDVKSGKYYENAVIWAAENGIVGGYASGRFGANDPITRQQLAAILYRYAKYMGYDVSAQAELSNFSDAGAISSYALAPLAWANADGLIQGSDGSLMPQGNAKRCQVAAILHRFCENIAK